MNAASLRNPTEAELRQWHQKSGHFVPVGFKAAEWEKALEK